MDKDNILTVKMESGKDSQKVTVSYFIPETNRNHTEEIKEQPHIDFINALKALSTYVAKVFYVNNDNEFLYSATGFKYSRNDKLILTGKVSTISGSIVGISTPAINLEEDIYGFEENLKKDADILANETLLLLTNKKVGVKQLTIEDQLNNND